MMHIEFNNTSAYTKGLIQELLIDSYKDIPSTSDEDRESFKRFDNDVSEHPNWLGTNVFITTADSQPVGFVSFDPRQRPVALIGHNAIIPEFRSHGLGTIQMKKAISEIKRQGFEKIIVSTCNNDFFLPAQKMYKSCGFKETGTFQKEGTEMIGFELFLSK